MSDNIYRPRNVSLAAWLREEIMRLWEKNVSAVAIARALNPLLQERGEKALTRNAVIGHVYRARCAGDLRAEARTLSKINAERTKDREAEAAPPKVRAMPISLAPVRFTKSLPKENLTNYALPFVKVPPVAGGKRNVLTVGMRECHFPMDDFDKDGRRVYCGAPAISAVRQYCQHHNLIVYRRIQPVEEVNAL